MQNSGMEYLISNKIRLQASRQKLSLLVITQLHIRKLMSLMAHRKKKKLATSLPAKIVLIGDHSALHS